MTLVADADTSITADTDDQIDIKIGGADDFQFTANTFTAQSGSTIAAQALTATTITASGIVKTDDTTDATSTTDGSLQTDGGLSVVKDAVIGDDLLMLSDSAAIKFGADSEITLTHSADSGLLLKHANTADDSFPTLTLQTGDTDIASGDVLGRIAFQAPDEGAGTDAIVVPVNIEAVSQGDFSASNNATSLIINTSTTSEAGTAGDGGKFSFIGNGEFIIKSMAIPDDNYPVLSFQTGETDIAADDILGFISFTAPDEATGSDANLIAASILARSEGDFSASSNATSLEFRTGASEAATTKMTLTSAGNLQLGSANDFSGIQDTLQLGDSQEFRLYHNSGGGNSVACMLSTANSMQVFTDVIRFTSADNSESLFGADKDGGFFAKHDNNTAISTRANSGSAVRINFVDNISNSDVTANNVKGIIMHHSGAIACSSGSGDVTGDFNRADDGTVLLFRSAGGSEGSISISGSTTSLGSMTGTHWSRLADNSKPNILRGTVMETIDEMVDWYNVEFDKNIFYTESDDTIPNGKKVGDVKETITVQRQIGLLPDGKSVGDTTTYTDEDVEYTGKIVKQADEKHVKCKISDTAECTNVYGVFMSWDEDDDTVNDMNVASLGTMVVRIHKDQTVSKGDLLTSNGDGTAKKQSDDIIRTKTIGKVLTNIKQETYSDGSYTVPCALYCG